MPKAKRPKPLYQRGDYQLHQRPDRANLTIIYYDRRSKRERCFSSGTSEIEASRAALDRRYLETTQGLAICPTCGQARTGTASVFVALAITDYLLATEDRSSAKAIGSRLAHIVAYIGTLQSATVRCDEIDEAWISKFRQWAIRQPIISPRGARRPRSLSTVENSVLQLAAAINHAHARHDTPWPAAFKSIPARDVNRTPQYRADIATLIEMFRYATALERRLPLLRFLRLSVGTLGRPDAVHEASTDPKRGQWNSERAVLALNPRGRHQTKKYRAMVPVVAQIAAELDVVCGHYVSVVSVKKSFSAMSKALGLPGDGESGMKLIRRSMAKLLRDKRVPNDEVAMMLGHRVLNTTSLIYAPDDPDYCAQAKAAISTICDEISDAIPVAFYRVFNALLTDQLESKGAING